MIENAQVIGNEAIGDPRFKLHKLVLKSEISLEARPGQFVHIQVTDGIDPLLRRPISIAKIDRENKEITLLYRVKGKGTEKLAKVASGNTLDLIGPVGNGFTIPEKGELLLIAGGIGAFPLLSLALVAKSKNISVKLLWGGESKEFFESAGLDYWQEANIPVEVSTLDGSMGTQGNIIDLLNSKKDLLQNANHLDSPSIAVCGPNPMMQVVSEYFLEKGHTAVEVSLEERMGCAVGACLGCVCTLKDEKTGKLMRARVCKDGPVFKAKEVVWNE